MSRPTQALVDLKALQHNFQCVKKYAPQSRIMAMVKANGYGHGAVPVAQALVAADALGVACLEEAIELRDAGINHRLVLVEGVLDKEEMALAGAHQLDIVIHHPQQLALLSSLDVQTSLDVWLKVDTGMHRLGFPPEQVLAVYRQLVNMPAVGTVHLMTHLACADELDNDFTSQQQAVFEEAAKGINAAQSLANSAAIMAWPNTHKDWVRPGIMLYGATPSPDWTMEQPPLDQSLRPVMTLRSELIAIKQIKAGEGVGYGLAWSAPSDTRIGVVAIGYGDGYPRALPNGTPVLVDGKEAPLVGRVSMDMITVDLSEHPAAEVGAPVVLWGPGLPLETVARYAETIPYELTCGVTARVPRTYIHT